MNLVFKTAIITVTVIGVGLGCTWAFVNYQHHRRMSLLDRTPAQEVKYQECMDVEMQPFNQYVNSNRSVWTEAFGLSRTICEIKAKED